MNCIPSRRASFAAEICVAGNEKTTSAWRFNVMAAISIRMSTPFWRRDAANIRDIIEPFHRAEGAAGAPSNPGELRGRRRNASERNRLLRLAVVDRMFVNGRVPLLVVWPGIVVEAAVQQRSGIRRLQGFVQLPKVTVDKLSNRIGNRLRVRCIDVRPDNGQARQEIATINEDRRLGHTSHSPRTQRKSQKESPKGSASLMMTELTSVRECGVLPRGESLDSSRSRSPRQERMSGVAGGERSTAQPRSLATSTPARSSSVTSSSCRGCPKTTR